MDKTAARATVPLSLRASPVDIPKAKSIGKFSKTILPAAFISIKIICNQRMFRKLKALSVFGLDNVSPIPSKSPAAGNIAIGNINALPKF